MAKVDDYLEHRAPQTTLPSGVHAFVVSWGNLQIDDAMVKRGDLQALVDFIADAYNIRAKEIES